MTIKWVTRMALCTAALACTHIAATYGGDSVKTILETPAVFCSRILAHDFNRLLAKSQVGDKSSLSRQQRRSRLEYTSGSAANAAVVALLAVENVTCSRATTAFLNGEHFYSGRAPPTLET